MRYVIGIVGLALALSGCARVEQVFGRAPEPEAPRAEAPRTAETLDSTTAAERQAAVTAASTGQGQDLGLTVASLGTPTEPGLWLKTPLVDAAAKGRVSDAATGKSVAVDLIPLDAPPGAGSRLSLAAFRAIGASLTALPELRVYRLAD
jgi:hypothetical protein